MQIFLNIHYFLDYLELINGKKRKNNKLTKMKYKVYFKNIFLH